MKILSSQLRVTTKPKKTSLPSFEKKLKHYNTQEQMNTIRINKLIKQIDQECKLSTHEKRNECMEMYINLQYEYDSLRRVKNLKQKLFSKHNLHWDEEYY